MKNTLGISRTPIFEELSHDTLKSAILHSFNINVNKIFFVCVENLFFIANKLIDDVKIAFRIYRITDDESLPKKEVFAIIGESVNKPAKIVKISKLSVNIFTLTRNFLTLLIFVFCKRN